MAAPSISATSSRASQSESRRQAASQEAIFQVLDNTSRVYLPQIEWISVLVDLTQPLAFALNPHVWGHKVTWSIVYFAHLPFWDGRHNGDIGFGGFLAIFWALAALVLISLISLVYGIFDPHFVSTKIIRSAGVRHILNVTTGALLIPILHMCFTLFAESFGVGEDDEELRPQGSLWLFADVAVDDPLTVAHVAAAAFIGLSAAAIAYLLANTSFSADFWSVRRQSYSYADRLQVLYRITMVVSFHFQLSRRLTAGYFVALAIASLLMVVVYCFVLPFHRRWLNTSYALSYSATAWCALVGLVAVKSDGPSSDSFLIGGGFYGLLGGGWILFGAITFWASRARYCASTDRLLAAALKSDFVPREENPFAVAAMSGDADLLPFPVHLPLSDYAFSPHRFVEGDIVEELLRRESENAQHFDDDGNPVGHVSEGIARYIDRIQVVSPSISAVYLPTDAELACRFLDEWVELLAINPTPHMLSFACRIYCKAMMKFNSSPIISIHFVKFLSVYAPSLSRMNLSISILDDIPRKMYCGVSEAFQLYRTGRSVRQMLGLRDKTHQAIFAAAKQLHRDTLVETAALWSMIEQPNSEIVALAALANSLTEHATRGLSTYVQALHVAHDDEMLLRSFSMYLSAVLHHSSLADDCREEADAVSQKRRNNLLSAASYTEDSHGPSRGGNDGEKSAAVLSRVGSAASSSRVSGDTASVAIHGIIEAVNEHLTTFRHNLHSSVFFASVVAVFAMLFLLIAAQAALVLSISVERETRVDQLQVLGRELAAGQQAVYMVRHLRGVIHDTASEDHVRHHIDALATLTNEIEALHSSITHGGNAMRDATMVKFLQTPSIFIYPIPSNATLELEEADKLPVGFWDLMFMYVAALHQVVDVARNALPGDDLFQNKHVIFVLRNGPRGVSSGCKSAILLLDDEDTSSNSSIVLSLLLALGATVIIITAVTFVFLWNFRRMATLHVKALRLFRLVPRDAVKRLTSEAKDSVERFMSGEVETKEGMVESSLHDPLAQSTSSAASETPSNENARRESAAINANLLHKFLRKSSQVIVKDHGQRASVSATEQVPIVELLGAKPLTEDSVVSKDSSASSTSQRHQDKQASILVTGGANGAKEPRISDSVRRRPSISMDRALIAHRASVSLFGEHIESESDEEESGVTIPTLQKLEQVEESERSAGGSAGASPTADKDITFTWTPKLLLSLAALTLLIGIGTTIAFVFTGVASRHNKEREWLLDRAVSFSDFTEKKFRLSTYTTLFAVSRFYSMYPMLDTEEVARSEQLLQSTFDLSRFDARRVFREIDWFHDRLAVSSAIAAEAAGFPANIVPQLASLRWEAPRPDGRFFARYAPFVYNTSQRMRFSVPEVDRHLPLDVRADVARAVALSHFIEGDMEIAQQQADVLHHRIILAAEETMTAQRQERSGLIIAAAAAFVCAIPATVVFFSECRISAPRKAVVLVAIVCAVCTGIVASMVTRDDGELSELIIQAVNSEHTSRYLHLFVRHPTSYVFEGDLSALESYAELLTSVDEDRRTSGILGTLTRDEDVRVVRAFFTSLADLRKMIKVGVFLAATFYGHVDQYPEIFTTDYNLQSDPNYRTLIRYFPEEMGALYTNKTADMRQSPEVLLHFAQRLWATRRFATAVSNVHAELEALDAVITKSLVTVVSGINAEETRAATIMAVGAGVLVFFFVMLLATLAIASVETLTSTRAEEEVYETMFASMTQRSITTMIGVAGLFVIVCACGIVFSYEVTDTQTVAATAPQRAWAVAHAMNLAEEVLASNITGMYEAQRQLRAVLRESLEIEQNTYFGSRIATSLRNEQNEALFGPASAFAVREVRSNAAGASAENQCYDAANRGNGNLATVTAQFIQLMDLMNRVAYYRLEDRQLPALSALVARARMHVGTTMRMLTESDKMYGDAAHGIHLSRRVILIVVLLVTFVAVTLAYVVMIRPIVLSLERQEVGVKLLLNILPHEIRSSIAEISDFFEGDNRGKDDMLKKKLQQSEKLLQNILPPLISRRLKNGEVCIADTHPNVTVVFSALIGFDEYSCKMKAQEIVMFLNDLIIVFDHIVDLLELEKIKTIGDVYFLCGGLTPKTKENHAMLCMECALTFNEAIKEHDERHSTPNLLLRSGINTDPAVAGVIGSTKVAYDLWGDSVNTASRMQSTGIPGKIQVSHNTFCAKSINEYYNFSERTIEAKGKGSMTTHVFESRAKQSPFQGLKWRQHR